MAYKPTDTYIPCTTNGFIVEAYTKSYRFSIAKPTKYPGEETVYGVIWIVDIEAMSKVDLASAQRLSGSDYKKDPTGNTYYPFEKNHYSFSNLYSFPEKNPKDGSDLYDPWKDIETRDDLKRIRLDLNSGYKRIEFGELKPGYSVDEFIDLTLKYLRNKYIDIVYGRRKDPIWVDAAKRSDAGEITQEETTKIYDEIGNRAENKVALIIDGDEPVVEEVYTGKYISASAFSTPTVPIEITFDIYKGEKLIESKKNSTGFVFEETNKQIYFLASAYFYDANGKWLDRYGETILPKDTKIEITGYPFPESPDPAGMSASGVDNGSPSGKPTTNPVLTVGKFTLKVKSGPGVIIGVTEVEIFGGKADFSGIQFDQPGDYVVTLGSTSPDVESTEIKFKVLPEPEVIPQEEGKGVTESNTSGTRPIITQIDRPTIEVKPMEFERQGTDKGGSSQVATTIGLTPFLSFGGSQINDRDIISFSLYHDGMIPKVDILFRDTNGMISKEPPRDDTKFDIFLNSRSVNLKYIHLIFKIEEFIRMEAGQYSLSGTLDVSDLYRNKYTVRRGTSFEALRAICKDLKIGFNSNIENTNDSMPWRNVGDKEYKFMEDIIKHSYISEESFMAGYIDYCFNYVDIEKEMKRDISSDVGIDTGGIDKPSEKDVDKITKLILTTEKGQQSSNMVFVKRAERNESTKISMEQGYRTRTKFYDTVKKMFLVFDVDSTTTDGSKSHILKAGASDKEAFDNNYVTKYQGKIDTDNVHKNYNYAVTQNKINLDNMMKNQLDISLPNPNFNLYRFQKIQVFLVKEAATVSAPESIQWRYSGEWMIASIKYTFQNGSLTQDITLARKEMGKDPEEIKEGTNNGTKETKDQKNENPIVGSASSTVLYKPNEKYKVGDKFTVQDSSGKRYILTINKLSENGVDVVTSLKDPTVIPNPVLTSPDTISGVTQSEAPTGPSASTILATASGIYRDVVELKPAWGGIDGDYTQARVSDATGNYSSLDRNGNLTSPEDNLKKSKSLFIAIKRAFPTYKPTEDWQKASTPFNWTVFELTDSGIEDFFTNDIVISPHSQNNNYNLLDQGNPKIYESLKSRIFYGQDKWGHLNENGEKLWGSDAWSAPKGSIRILDEQGNVAKECDNTNSFTSTTAQVRGGFAGTPPKYEYDRWFAYPGDGSPTASILVDKGNEYTPVGGENTLYYDMSSGFKPGVYTLEIKYYVPLYEKINYDGENAGKPYNGTGMWEVKKQRLMTKDPVTGHHPYEEKILKANFSIVKKPQRK